MARMSERYLELFERVPLRPIRSDRELERASTIINELVVLDKRSREEDDYLDVLSDLIEKYEKAHHPIPPLPPHQMLAESLATKGVTQSEVSTATGIPLSTISELISQKRSFNLGNIQKLSAYFGLEPTAFIHLPSQTLPSRFEHDFSKAAKNPYAKRLKRQLTIRQKLGVS